MLTNFNKYRGVIADMAIVSGSDGHAKYAYIVDLGGNVFRITMTGAPTAWTMKHIASLGCDTASAGCTANRKFMYAPSVVNTATGEYTIMVGSGDREKPITGYVSATAVTNYFFQFKDKPDDATYPGITDCGGGAHLLGLAVSDRQRRHVTHEPGNQERLVPGPQFNRAGGDAATHHIQRLTFSTHEPAVANSTPTAGTCSNLGTTRVYNVATSTRNLRRAIRAMKTSRAMASRRRRRQAWLRSTQERRCLSA